MADGAAFHPDTRESSEPSASVVAAILTELVAPRSVLDVGCGTGAWLRAFPAEVTTLGLDELPEERVEGNYRRISLVEAFDVGRFDLALCFEVAEHLPESAAADLVESLVRSAPVVTFSAAIPGQPGEGHRNCRWPEYWRDLFAAHGYAQYDVIRSRTWDDERVAWWYAQNTFLYSATRAFDGDPLPERIVHPGLYDLLALTPQQWTPSVSGVVRAAPGALRRAVRHRIARGT